MFCAMRLAYRKTELIFKFSVIVVIYSFVCYMLVTIWNNGSTTSILPMPIDDDLIHNPKFRKNVLFLKIHKTASSTIQNILMRFGLRHSLNFLLPKKHNYLGYSSPIEFSMVPNDTIPLDRKFNIFTHHTRFHPKTLEFLYDDVVKVTMLRYPPEHFESMYNFFGLDKTFGVELAELLQALPNTTINFKRKTVMAMSVNQMSHDLGFNADKLSGNESEIRKYLDFVDTQFDLVMINEYFDASLILLADLMGWPLNYVSYLPQVQRTTTKYQLTKEDESKLAQLVNVDSLFYDHFLNKFKRRLIEYGADRMVSAMNTLRRINEGLYNKCVAKEDRSGYAGTTGYKLKNSSDWECIYVTKTELTFTDEIRNEQGTRLNVTRKTLELILNSR